MAVYKGTPATVDTPAEVLFHRFDDLRDFSHRIEELPAEAREKVKDLRFEKDAIEMDTPQVGKLRFEVAERIEPTKLVLRAPQSPVEMRMEVDFVPVSETSASVSTTIDVDVPAMIRPFVGPKLQDAANKFSEMIATLSGQ